VQGISTEEEAIEFLKSREVLVELGSDKEKVKSYLKAQFRVDEHSYYIEENKKILSTFLAFLKDN
jgi:hypothetical protein